MYYIYQILAAILIGVTIGATLGPRSSLVRVSSVAVVALGIVTLVTASWEALVAGTVIFLLVQSVQRDTAVAQS